MLIVFAIAGYLALLIQTAAPLWFPFHALIPNLIIILTVGPRTATSWGASCADRVRDRIRDRCDVRHHHHRYECVPDDRRVPADL